MGSKWCGLCSKYLQCWCLWSPGWRLVSLPAPLPCEKNAKFSLVSLWYIVAWTCSPCRPCFWAECLCILSLNVPIVCDMMSLLFVLVCGYFDLYFNRGHDWICVVPLHLNIRHYQLLKSLFEYSGTSLSITHSMIKILC